MPYSDMQILEMLQLQDFWGFSAACLSFAGAFLCSLNTKTPEQAFSEPSGKQTGLLEAHSRVYVLRLASVTLQEERFRVLCTRRTPNGPLKTLTSLNTEVRPFFLSDNSIWSFLSVSSLSDYSIWRS